MHLDCLPDPDALTCRVADWLLDLSILEERVFAIALSGGTTPRRLYERLAGPACIGRFPWSRIHWFWGDERFVPRDDARSNYRMVREALLSRAPIPVGNIHPIPTEGVSPWVAARAYEIDLRSFYGADHFDPTRPLFDVTLLGLGPDGHTASLFPGAAVLDERHRWVAAVAAVEGEPRITLTYPALESCRHAAFLVAGADKREILGRLCRGDQTLPAARLRPAGSLTVFADAAAADAIARSKEREAK
jgi:6-phosphogluconolactonase